MAKFFLVYKEYIIMKSIYNSAAPYEGIITSFTRTRERKKNFLLTREKIRRAFFLNS